MYDINILKQEFIKAYEHNLIDERYVVDTVYFYW